jgi:hypothetical protein
VDEAAKRLYIAAHLARATGVELSTEPITQFFMLPLLLCCNSILNGLGMRECKQRLVHPWSDLAASNRNLVKSTAEYVRPVRCKIMT